MLDRIEKYLSHLGVVSLALLFIMMLAQVVLRYSFGYTHFLTEELGRYLLVWASLAGMAVETRSGGQIRVSFLVDRLSEGLRRAWMLCVDLLVLLLFLLLVYTGLGSMVFNHSQESAGLQIPLSIPFAGIPLFFALAAVFLSASLWSRRGRGR